MVWMSSVSKTELLHKTPDMIGTTFREIVEEDGRGTELQGVVTEYKPNQLISFHLSGQLNPDIAADSDDRRRNFDFRQGRRCFFAQAYLMYAEHKKVPADTA